MSAEVSAPAAASAANNNVPAPATVKAAQPSSPGISKTLFVLFCLFGISSWTAINGVFLQAYALIMGTPEGVDVLTNLSVVVQCANIVPFLYVVGLHYKWRIVAGAAKREATIIYALIAFGILASIALATTWDRTIDNANGNSFSFPLYATVFALAVVDCTSSLVYWSYVFHPAFSGPQAGDGINNSNINNNAVNGGDREQHAVVPAAEGQPQRREEAPANTNTNSGSAVVALSTGENLSGVVMGIVALIQSARAGTYANDADRFSTGWYFATIAIVMLLSGIAFYAIEAKRRNWMRASLLHARIEQRHQQPASFGLHEPRRESPPSSNGNTVIHVGAAGTSASLTTGLLSAAPASAASGGPAAATGTSTPPPGLNGAAPSSAGLDPGATPSSTAVVDPPHEVGVAVLTDSAAVAREIPLFRALWLAFTAHFQPMMWLALVNFLSNGVLPSLVPRALCGYHSGAILVYWVQVLGVFVEAGGSVITEIDVLKRCCRLTRNTKRVSSATSQDGLAADEHGAQQDRNVAYRGGAVLSILYTAICAYLLVGALRYPHSLYDDSSDAGVWMAVVILVGRALCQFTKTLLWLTLHAHSHQRLQHAVAVATLKHDDEQARVLAAEATAAAGAVGRMGGAVTQIGSLLGSLLGLALSLTHVLDSGYCAG